MLTLKRKRYQSFVFIVDGRVIASVVITEINGSSVRCGIEASDHVRILRNELYEEGLEKTLENQDEVAT